MSLISERHPALLLPIRRTLGGLPGPLVVPLVNTLFMTLAVKSLNQWEFGRQSPFATSGYMARIYQLFPFWGGECWGEQASRRVWGELWSISCPGEEALTVTAERSQRCLWLGKLWELGELEHVTIVWYLCGAQIFLREFAESHAFHCLSWVAIKLRGRTLFLSKSKVSRRKVKISKATRTLTLWI